LTTHSRYPIEGIDELLFLTLMRLALDNLPEDLVLDLELEAQLGRGQVQ
jgi:hypothetical protein